MSCDLTLELMGHSMAGGLIGALVGLLFVCSGACLGWATWQAVLWASHE